MKNYIGFLNDESGSMYGLKDAAVRDYNANVNAFAGAASKYMQDTIVSMFGFNSGTVTRYVVNSNPHVLKPLTSWKSSGGTPMRKGIMALIDLFKSMPDYKNPEVSFTILVTTDGEADRTDAYTIEQVGREIAELSRSERWTFVFRVPRGGRRFLHGLNIPEGNIQEWDTTIAGMAASTAATEQAVDTFYATRAAGKKSSNVFYANAAAVNTSTVKAKLEDISTQVSMWTVLAEENGAEILPFSQKRLGNAPFLKGAAFYQLTKTEARVQDTKVIALRDKATGHVYCGAAARDLIGLPQVGTCRLHPGDHGGYDIFVQSTSINRKLVAGTQVLYFPKLGTGFSAADFPWLTNGQTSTTTQQAAAAQVIQATAGIKPVVSPAPTSKPTPSPVKGFSAVTPVGYGHTATSLGYQTFKVRDDARAHARTVKRPLRDLGKGAVQRWAV
jgi:hypothetical protein